MIGYPREYSFSRKAFLLPQPQFLDELVVPPHVLPAEIGQQPAPLADELDQAPLGMMVFTVGRHVRGQFVDAPGEKRHLHLGSAGIAFASLIGLDDFGLFLFFQISVLPILISLFKYTKNYNIIRGGS